MYAIFFTKSLVRLEYSRWQLILNCFSQNGGKILSCSITSQNELLKALISVPSIATNLLPELKVVPLAVNQVLYELGDQVDYLYFPLDSVVSDLTLLEDGMTIETSMSGPEGLVGISTILGSRRASNWIWVTISGHAIQLEAKVFEKLVVQNETVITSVFSAYQALLNQVSQRCVCNTRHTILERLSCWLLMIHDRVGETNLQLTQDLIASKVGARRAGITVAAGVLQQMNAIAYSRGQLHINNREILLRAVCECYHIMQADFRRGAPEATSLSRCM